jgi:hypothetical protein
MQVDSRGLVIPKDFDNVGKTHIAITLPAPLINELIRGNYYLTSRQEIGTALSKVRDMKGMLAKSYVKLFARADGNVRSCSS